MDFSIADAPTATIAANSCDVGTRPTTPTHRPGSGWSPGQGLADEGGEAEVGVVTAAVGEAGVGLTMVRAPGAEPQPARTIATPKTVAAPPRVDLMTV